MDAQNDFVHRDGGYLNDSGRSKYLKAFTKDGGGNFYRFRRETTKWDILTQQVKAYKQFVYEPKQLYQPYQIHSDAVLCSGLRHP